jgi:hypothetical protein
MKLSTNLNDTGQKENNHYQLQELPDLPKVAAEDLRNQKKQIPPRFQSITTSLGFSVILILNLFLPVASARANIMWDDQAYTSSAHSTFRHTARCFSCMSKFYEAVWPALAHVYKRPRNFTDRCNDLAFDPQSIPTTHCSTICVQMWEEPIVAGVKIRGHIRGCLDDILHNGFNQSIVAWYRWLHRDSCHRYRKRDLFMLPHEQSDDSLIHVCTCYADHCNTDNGNGRSLKPISLIIAIIISFIGRYYVFLQ